jgi:hypothetical protein
VQILAFLVQILALLAQILTAEAPAAILDVEKDEPHIDAAKKLRRLFKTLALPVPFSL